MKTSLSQNVLKGRENERVQGADNQTRLCWVQVCLNISYTKSSLRASSRGHSGGGEGKGRRVCNYVSGMLIPPPIPLWLPVE